MGESELSWACVFLYINESCGQFLGDMLRACTNAALSLSLSSIVLRNKWRPSICCAREGNFKGISTAGLWVWLGHCFEEHGYLSTTQYMVYILTMSIYTTNIYSTRSSCCSRAWACSIIKSKTRRCMCLGWGFSWIILKQSSLIIKLKTSHKLQISKLAFLYMPVFYIVSAHHIGMALNLSAIIYE